MNAQMIRVSIIGPDYRTSILAHSYTLMYDEKTNKCEIQVEGSDDRYTFSATYDIAGQYAVTVSPVGVLEPGEKFLLCSVHPEESAT